MKRETWVTAGIAAALSFLICFGAVGCVISGFDLTVQNVHGVVLAWSLASVFCAAAFSLKWGGIAVLCVLALTAGYLWRRGEAAEQLFALLYHVTYIYNRAYGWGVLQLTDTPWNGGTADIPMAVLGIILSIAVTWAICRKKGPVFPVTVSLLPLCACLVVTDTVPEEGYLFSLILGLVILILTGRVRAYSPSQGNRLTAMAALPAALALLALFWAVPQESYVNQSKATREAILSWFQSIPQKVESAAQNMTVAAPPVSEPERVNLASLGRRVESPATIMEVTAEIGGSLYLRGQDYDSYDGTIWTSSDHRTEDFSYAGEDYGDVAIRTAKQQALLYLPYYPARGMTLIGGKMENTWEYTEYVIPRSGLPDDWRKTAVSATGSPANPDSPYLSLPDEARSRAEALLPDILAGASSTVEKAEKIGAFVCSSARYDLNPSRMDTGETDFALWFLESGEAGYCVHFATAAAVLLRAAGIEARYVSGYLVKTHPGVTAAVTGKNAHAWAEYYEPALNTWLVLEATPADAAAEQAPTPETVPETAAPTLPEPAPTDTPTTLPSKPDFPAESIPSQQFPPEQHSGGTFLTILFPAVLLLLLVAAQRFVRIRLRRLGQQSTSPNARGLALWQETELLSKLLRQTPPEALEALAQKAKFSQHTLTSEELSRFSEYLRSARRQLRQKPWYLRLVYRYVYAVI